MCVSQLASGRNTSALVCCTVGFTERLHQSPQKKKSAASADRLEWNHSPASSSDLVKLVRATVSSWCCWAEPKIRSFRPVKTKCKICKVFAGGAAMEGSRFILRANTGWKSRCFVLMVGIYIWNLAVCTQSKPTFYAPVGAKNRTCPFVLADQQVWVYSQR